MKKISDELFLYPGVDRPYMKSLWTPSVRWTGVTEEGLDGGPVVPDDYDGSPESLAQVRLNSTLAVFRSGGAIHLGAGHLVVSRPVTARLDGLECVVQRGAVFFKQGV